MEVDLVLKNDLSEILELQKSCYLEEAEIYNDFEIPPLTQTLESIENDFEKESFFKIEIDHRIIASIRTHVEKETCKIGRLIVDKDFRNQGIGTKLIQAVEFKFDSVKRFELFTGHKSERNLSLYKKLGYTEFKSHQVNEKLKLVFLEKMNIMTV
jgi:GNAT superfamily N-acetyltransferase